jgi:hypothetical protein
MKGSEDSHKLKVTFVIYKSSSENLARWDDSM